MNRIHRIKTFLANNKAQCREADRKAMAVMVTVGVVAFCLMPELAMANVGTGVANKVLSILTSGIARTVAIIAVMVLGFTAYFGKMSWERAFHIILGITFTFGAAAIVDMISSAVG